MPGHGSPTLMHIIGRNEPNLRSYERGSVEASHLSKFEYIEPWRKGLGGQETNQQIFSALVILDMIPKCRWAYIKKPGWSSGMIRA
jgi:hypothetical protein